MRRSNHQNPPQHQPHHDHKRHRQRESASQPLRHHTHTKQTHGQYLSSRPPDHDGYSTIHHQQHHHRYYQQQQQQQVPYSNPIVPPPPLPPGWVEATDPASGKIYFANPTTQETRWDRPTLGFPSPQPHPPFGSNTLPPAVHTGRSGQVHAQQSYSGDDQSDRMTGSSIGDGNAMYTAGSSAGTSGGASTNEAMSQHPENIVKVTREMLEQVQAAASSPLEQTPLASDLELHTLTPGQVASLCHLQRRVQQQQQQQQSGAPDESYTSLPPYTPINPFTMPISGSMLMNRTEPGRLDVRMHSLRQELKAFGYNKSNNTKKV